MIHAGYLKKRINKKNGKGKEKVCMQAGRLYPWKGLFDLLPAGLRFYRQDFPGRT